MTRADAEVLLAPWRRRVEELRLELQSAAARHALHTWASLNGQRLELLRCIADITAILDAPPEPTEVAQ